MYVPVCIMQAYTPSQPAKLHSSKIITPQPRILAPITPKAHIMQV